MTLSAMDDYLVHQIVEPVRHLGTSDRNFYDRHYFNLYAPGENIFVVLGTGQYPNLGTQDAFVMFGTGTGQTALRSSRLLGDRACMSCGPITIDVIEGLKRLRIAIGPNDTAFECDAVFNGTHEPSLEPRSVSRVGGRVVHDIMRYNQVGFYQGHVRLGDRVISSDQQPMRGYRDRSWGIRPVGEIEPDGVKRASAGGSASGAPSFMFIKVPADFGNFSIHLNVIEHNDGRRSLDQAELVWNDGRPAEHLESPRFEFDFSPDMRFVERARIAFGDAHGGHRVLTATPLVPLYIEAGSGYGRGRRDEWTHGVFRGDDVTDVVTLDFALPDPRLYGGIDAFSRFEFEGAVGHGLFEYSFFGPLDRFGFSGPGFFNQYS